MAEFSEKAYEAAIPPCCSVQTLQGHKDMLMCWSLEAALRKDKPMDCTGCDLKKPEDQLGEEHD